MTANPSHFLESLHKAWSHRSDPMTSYDIAEQMRTDFTAVHLKHSILDFIATDGRNRCSCYFRQVAFLVSSLDVKV